MPTIASAVILDGQWFGPIDLEYRMFSWSPWVSATGELNEAGSPFDRGQAEDVYRRGDCTVDNNSVTLPSMSPETTNDAIINPNVRLCLALFSKSTNKLAAVLIASFGVTSGDSSLGDLL